MLLPRGALRKDTKNSCVADCILLEVIKIYLSNLANLNYTGHIATARKIG